MYLALSLSMSSLPAFCNLASSCSSIAAIISGSFSWQSKTHFTLHIFFNKIIWSSLVSLRNGRTNCSLFENFEILRILKSETHFFKNEWTTVNWREMVRFRRRPLLLLCESVFFLVFKNPNCLSVWWIFTFFLSAQKRSRRKKRRKCTTI